MKLEYVSFEQAGQFSKLFLDYMDQDKSLSAFYKYPPVIDSFSKTIKDVSEQKCNRKLLVEVINEQYATSKLSIPNSEILLKETTFTVCAGHQLCLFTGPLYFIYKIISTINLAEALKKKYPENDFVPVYWMASEDHDFEEINHVNLFGKKLEWKLGEANSLKSPVGTLKTNSLKGILDELKGILGESDNAKELVYLFENAYLKNEDISSATQHLVNSLFGKYGLLVLEPNDKRLKLEFADIMLDDLINNSSYKSIGKTIASLEEKGHQIQVNPREINLFYIFENQRNRIVKENNKFNIIETNISFTEAELKSELRSYPERFSPNVVTRPLYQQKILPNLAYVGGPGEIAYWLEYMQIFNHYKIPFPVLIPRNFVMQIDASISDKLYKLNLTNEDVFLSVNELTQKYVSSISGEKISFNFEKENIEKLFDKISDKVALVDASLVASAKAEMQKNLKTLDELEKKMLKAFKQKNETSVSQIENIKTKLFPNNVLQERHDNFMSFYLKQGKSFIETLKKNLNLFDNRLIILSEK